MNFRKARKPVNSSHALPSVAARPGQDRVQAASNPLSEFFRYHGIWAPGVRLFRALGFRSKAMLISAVFLLPISLLALSFFSDKAATIAFTAKEQVGVAYLRTLSPLMRQMQLERFHSLQEVAKGAPSPELAEARNAVAAGLQALAATQAKLGVELDTQRGYAELLEKSKALPGAAAGLKSVKAAHDARLQAFLVLMSQVADNSNLTLDPDLDTFYLMEAATSTLPTLVEALGQLRGMAAAVAAGAQTSADITKALHGSEAVGALMASRWATSVDKVGSLHPAFKGDIGVEAVAAATTQFFAAVASGDAADKIKASGDVAVDGLHKARALSLDKLDQLLAERIAGMQTHRNAIGALVALSLLLAFYLFISFRKVLDGGLKEVAFHIDAMRDGDLTTNPQAWGADEAAKLMTTLSAMQASLRRIVKQVRGASDSIVHASSEISSASMDLSGRTESSAASLEETAAAMEQISATVRNNEDALREATRLALTNAEGADRGGQTIAQVVATMQQISASSGRIGDIIGTIDSIAFQTNILALNAAIEAARAGEQGRGFAVVASEVRALAHRSSAAAREIKALITSSVEQTDNGTRVVHAAGTVIDEIVSTARRVRELLDDVAAGAKEQTLGIAESAKAVQELDTATQQNAALVEQTAAAAASLKDQALTLSGEVAQFKLPAY